MAITAADIHNQSFSIDRKGYDVDEVDVFLEHVADEIDGLNNQIAQLESQLDDRKFDGFDVPARMPEPPAHDERALAEKDERIAELEHQLEVKKADDNAIARALIIAQRSADEIIANANAQSASTIKNAEEEAGRIVNMAENEKKKVLDAIKKLEDEREDAREDYQDLLVDFINDATRKLADIGGSLPAGDSFSSTSAHARVAAPAKTSSAGWTASSAQVPINQASDTYTVPLPASNVVVTPATPKPSAVEKDFSGFGDTDDAFEFEDLD